MWQTVEVEIGTTDREALKNAATIANQQEPGFGDESGLVWALLRIAQNTPEGAKLLADAKVFSYTVGDTYNETLHSATL